MGGGNCLLQAEVEGFLKKNWLDWTQELYHLIYISKDKLKIFAFVSCTVYVHNVYIYIYKSMLQLAVLPTYTGKTFENLIFIFYENINTKPFLVRLNCADVETSIFLTLSW